MSRWSFFKKLKEKKHFQLILALSAVALMLIIYFSTLIGPTKKTETVDETENYCRKMERQIAETLSSMKGAGKVELIVSWESGIESVIAYITNTNGSSISTSPQLVTDQGVTKPIVLKEIYPKALGVVIICEGGDNVQVRLDIMNAVSLLLSITPEKINVYSMQK